MLNIEFHTSRATDYGINFIKRFNVVISIADDLDVINYLKLTCSAANVSLVDKEMILLSEKGTLLRLNRNYNLNSCQIIFFCSGQGKI